MTFTDQERTARFIDAAKEHRQWLSGELSSLDTRSENYESNQRAIRAAIGELDKVISNAIQTGMAASCRMTVTPDGLSAHCCPPLRITVEIPSGDNGCRLDTASYFNFTKSNTKIAHTPTVTGN